MHGFKPHLSQSLFCHFGIAMDAHASVLPCALFCCCWSILQRHWGTTTTCRVGVFLCSIFIFASNILFLLSTLPCTSHLTITVIPQWLQVVDRIIPTWERHTPPFWWVRDVQLFPPPPPPTTLQQWQYCQPSATPLSLLFNFLPLGRSTAKKDWWHWWTWTVI